MPIYFFKCSSNECNKEKSIFCKMSELDEIKSTLKCDCGNSMERKIENMVCGLSVDNTNSFYRKVN